MAAATQRMPRVQSSSNRTSTTVPAKKHPQPARKTPNGVNQKQTKPAQPLRSKAASIAGESPVNGVTSAYSIMATRIANRVAEMAESITFVERPKPKEPPPSPLQTEDERRRPRKLEMRLEGTSTRDAVAFSAPFLDNTLRKMLALQNRMLASTAELAKTEGVGEKAVKEQAAQSAELSRIIALICAEKARQGV